jgi:hypothetical protein
MEGKEEVLREHFQECFEDFVGRFNSRFQPRSRGRREALRPMIDFFGVSAATVSHWFDEAAKLPQGESNIRLFCYLDLHGYKIIEFERLPLVLRSFAELIGYGVLAPKDAAESISYKDPSDLYAVIWQKAGVSDERQAKMWEVWKERKDALEAKKNEAFLNNRMMVLFKRQKKEQKQSASLITVNGDTSAALVSILDGSIVLLNSLSDKELAKFAQPILHLSSQFSLLSSRVLALKEE